MGAARYRALSGTFFFPLCSLLRRPPLRRADLSLWQCGRRQQTYTRKNLFQVSANSPLTVMPQWDFSSGILHRPKLQSHHHRLSMASSLSLANRRRTDAFAADHSTLLLPPPGAEGPLSRYHPAPSRNEVAIVQPVLVKQLENDILTAIAFLPRWLLTGTKVGHVKLWIRPLPASPRKNGHASRTATDAQDVDWVS
jgi:hypothetical protein